MTLDEPYIFVGSDVYILTYKGSNELQASQTGLGALSLKLLVLIDGRTTVAGILRRTNPAPSDEQFSAAVQELISGGYVDLNTNQLTQSFDFIEFFKETPTQPSDSALDQAQSEAASGITTLQRRLNPVWSRIVTFSKCLMPDSRRKSRSCWTSCGMLPGLMGTDGIKKGGRGAVI